eukprot:TRINITY_DN3908_c0_g1_i2.p1 TRINITY_DN3908_c0_g1~~TRINITY_DN3908_c0_g1_i2.p1  ORF type:complete len:658 (+),score=200.77 TRINITY_DN3908_c0_g1_i2:145-2118(+)
MICPSPQLVAPLKTHGSGIGEVTMRPASYLSCAHTRQSAPSFATHGITLNVLLSSTHSNNTMRVSLLLVLLAACASLSVIEANRVVPVTTATELDTAIQAAIPGDQIVLSATGTFTFRTIRCTASGTAEKPIIVRGEPGSKISLYSAGSSEGYVEGFAVTGSHWHFVSLDIQGTCDNSQHTYCEHAWHLAGSKDVVVRNCRSHEINQHIKSNINGAGSGLFADRLLVERNHMYNDVPRNTGNPATIVNIDGGDDCVVRGNYIHDGARVSSGSVTYQAFMKSNGAGGLFEQNLIVCSADHSDGGYRLGLSFGGGGTAPDNVCGQGTCKPEHRNGVMRNNVIKHCNDVGIYLNEAQNTDIYNNFIYDTTGIDCRFSPTTADVRNNIVAGGAIRNREGGVHTGTNNWITSVSAADAMFVNVATTDFKASWDAGVKDGANPASFEDAGVEIASVKKDYCGIGRKTPYDIGAFDYRKGTPCNVLTSLNLQLAPRKVRMDVKSVTLNKGVSDGDVKDVARAQHSNGDTVASPGAAGTGYMLLTNGNDGTTSATFKLRAKNKQWSVGVDGSLHMMLSAQERDVNKWTLQVREAVGDKKWVKLTTQGGKTNVNNWTKVRASFKQEDNFDWTRFVDQETKEMRLRFKSKTAGSLLIDQLKLQLKVQ